MRILTIPRAVSKGLNSQRPVCVEFFCNMAVMTRYQAARVGGQVFKASARLAGAPRRLPARPYTAGRRQLQQPGRCTITGGAAHVPAVAAVPQTKHRGGLVEASSPPVALAAVAWAFTRQSAAWLQPAFTAQSLGVLSLSAAVSLGLASMTRSLAASSRLPATLAVQYALMPALGYAAAQLLGLPLALTVCLCVAGGALGSLLARLLSSSPAEPVASRATAVPAAAAAVPSSPAEETSSSASATGPGAPMASQAACGLDAEAAAARLALAPPSVQAFIQRWGRREGIAGAYSAACATDWGAGAVLESTDEVPGHHFETAMEAAFRERLEETAAAVEAASAASLGVGVVEGANPAAGAAARLALAPPQVQSFILRWGSREGIDAAYAEPHC